VNNVIYVLGEQGLPMPLYLPANHPVVLRKAAVCLYSGLTSMGEGASVPEAKNDSARAMWLRLGHLISLDPRFISHS
jgi:hypothetical protein